MLSLQSDIEKGVYIVGGLTPDIVSLPHGYWDRLDCQSPSMKEKLIEYSIYSIA